MSDNKTENKYIIIESEHSKVEDEINFFDVIRFLHQSWKVIAGCILLSGIIAFFYAQTSPEVYKAEVLLAPAEQGNSGDQSSMSRFGGLVALAGINIPGSSNMERVLATLTSRRFLKHYIETQNALPLIFSDRWDKEKQEWILGVAQAKPTVDDGYAALGGAVSAEQEKGTSLIKLSVYWHNPKLAADWANDLVKQLNERLRSQAVQDSKKRVKYLEEELAKTSLKNKKDVLYNLLESEEQKAMLANVNENFSLEVIDPAVEPLSPEKPKKRLILILGLACGGFIGIFAALSYKFLQKYNNSKKENILSNV